MCYKKKFLFIFFFYHTFHHALVVGKKREQANERTQRHRFHLAFILHQDHYSTGQLKTFFFFLQITTPPPAKKNKKKLFGFCYEEVLGTVFLHQHTLKKKKTPSGKNGGQRRTRERGRGEGKFFFFYIVFIFFFYHIEMIRIIANIEQGIAFVQISRIAITIDFTFRIDGERLQELLPEDHIFLGLSVGDCALNICTSHHTHIKKKKKKTICFSIITFLVNHITI